MNRTFAKISLAVALAFSLSALVGAQLPGPPVGAPQSSQNGSYGYNFGYTFTPTGTTGVGLRNAPTLNLTTATGQNAYLAQFGGTIALPNSSATATTFAAIDVLAPTCTLNSGTLTNCANLVVEANPTGATNNYALWSKGDFRLDGSLLSSGGGWTFAGGTVTTSNPFTISQTWNAGGVSFIGTKLAYTETASASGAKYFQVLGGASGTTEEFSVQKSGTVNILLAANIAGTSNQMVIGTTNTDTLSFTAPAASRVITFGDPGGADSVVYLAATQTLTGKTLTAPVIATVSNTGTLTLPSATGGVPVVLYCGSTGVGNQTCSPATAAATTKTYVGHSTLSSNAAIITFSPAFASTTYDCVANDITTRANVVQMLSTSASTATITNTTGASDVINWSCTGQ